MSPVEPDVQDARVVGCRPSGRDGFVLRVELPAPLVNPLEGGRFFMLRTAAAGFPFLNRPFSVHDAAPSSRGPELEFLLKVVGEGTRKLAQSAQGDAIRLVGPLGRPFPGPDPSVTTLLVAGGVGLPPLFLWLRRRREDRRDDPALLLYGARRRDQLFELESARALGAEVRTATEDGSDGLHGRVDALLAATLGELEGRRVRVFTCGPDPMMAAVAELCAARGVPCHVSLETLMACGFGVCNACAVPIAAGDDSLGHYARACLDGPVMDGALVRWRASRH